MAPILEGSYTYIYFHYYLNITKFSVRKERPYELILVIPWMKWYKSLMMKCQYLEWPDVCPHRMPVLHGNPKAWVEVMNCI